MTKAKFFMHIRKDKDNLTEIVSKYHPALRGKPRHKVTAPNAQAACDVVCAVIRKDDRQSNPVERFHKAIEDRDVNTIMSILNDTWFGVPESTSCWSIPGFEEMVRLMEDPIEEKA